MALVPLTLHEDDFEHFHVSDEAGAAIAKTIADHDVVAFTTVGIDVGSSTSHLLFARITMAREALDLSARFAVVSREVLWRSPIMLTPFLPNGLIDADALDGFFRDAYAAAGLTTGDVDCGAVILTGEAIKRENARAVDELFASEAGKFVCATAGHELEAMLAAHGSGAVRVSRERGCALLHVDIGGGTTKLALIDRGRILGVAAFAVGGRLVARDAGGSWSRIDESARLAAADLGLPVLPATFADERVRERLARRLAGALVDEITDTPRDTLGERLLLTRPLPRTVAPSAISFSGGVAEYLFGRENRDFGDIANLLAGEIRRDLPARIGLPVLDPGVGIRATVIGASSFTVQVSGTTVFVPDESALPLRNVPVAGLRLPEPYTVAAIRIAIEAGLERNSLTRDATLAVAIEWNREPSYGEIRTLSLALAEALEDRSPAAAPLVLLIDGDIAKSVGHLLREELAFARPLVSIDGVRLADLDFVDVGEMVRPAGVIPLVIKSLVFH